AKPETQRDHMLMLDAHNVYRKVTRKIFDFSPEQLANLTSIVWLYRGQSGRFLALVRRHLLDSVAAAQASVAPLQEALAQMRALASALRPGAQGDAAAAQTGLDEALAVFAADVAAYAAQADAQVAHGIAGDVDSAALHQASARLAPLAESSRDLLKAVDHLYMLAGHVLDALALRPPPPAGGEDGPFARHCRADHPTARRAAPGGTGRGGGPGSRDLNRQRKSADEARRAA